jgi:hypothetical protein
VQSSAAAPRRSAAMWHGAMATPSFLLGNDVLFLHFVLLPLGVQDGQEVGQPAFGAAACASFFRIVATGAARADEASEAPIVPAIDKVPAVASTSRRLTPCVAFDIFKLVFKDGGIDG